MRRLMTFIVRLWLDVQAEPSTWEGEVECVPDGAHGPIRAPEDLLGFIAAHAPTSEHPSMPEASKESELATARQKP